MRQRYWIRPETEVLLSRDGGPFEPHTIHDNRIFERPALQVAHAMIFVDGNDRICVDTEHVIKYEWDGTRGCCLPCA